MAKKVLSLVLCALLLITATITGVVSASGTIPSLNESKPYIKATTTPVKAGEIAKVTFTMGNNPSFWGMNQIYKFDTSVLSFVEGETNEYGTFPKYDKGANFKNSLISPINDKGEFTFIFTEIYDDAEIKSNKSNGEIFSIYLKVADNAKAGTYDIEMVDYKAENYISISGSPVAFTFNQPAVEVYDPSATTTTTTTTTTTEPTTTTTTTVVDNDPTEDDVFTTTTTTTVSQVPTESTGPILPPEPDYEFTGEGTFEVKASELDEKGEPIEQVIKFVSPVSGKYTLKTTNEIYPSKAYDEDGNPPKYEESEEGSINLYFILEAGKTYYVHFVSFENGTIILDYIDNNVEEPTSSTTKTNDPSYDDDFDNTTVPTTPTDKVELKAPVIKAVQTAKTKITVTWDEVEGAEKYIVFRAMNGSKSFLKVGETTNLKLVNKIRGGNKYQYKVRAVRGEEYVDSTVKTVKCMKFTARPKIKVTKAKKSFKVKVTAKVKYAKGYQIRYSTNKNFKKPKVVLSGAKKTVKKLKANKTYFVKVRAYKIINGSKKYGKYSKVAKVKTK